MNNEVLYYIGFSHFYGIGPVKFSLLKKHFGSAKQAYLAKKVELKRVIDESLTEKFVKFRENFDLEKKYQEIENKNIKILTVDDVDYPEDLKNISDPPICLYIKVKYENFLSPLEPPRSREVQSRKKFYISPFLFFKNLLTFAIVGTRQPTSYGQQIAKKFSYELAKAGFIIVSGLAYGIDTIAHQSCLDAGGKTIAVLGCGVDVVYPASNRGLYEKIIEKGGLIISEFPPGQTVLKGLFISRNRIISALSKGVMVVEGSEDSGSLITARYAADQGKDVFAPPSPITSKMSAAPNLLLKQGAKLVTSVEDIFEEFNLKITPKKEEDLKANLNDLEKEIFEALKERQLMIEELVVKLQKPVGQILNTISFLEIKGIVKKNEQNYYEIVGI
ncbi:MAG: DNA-processing protein DprA [Candidatus Microgenomates bacterium]